jgi:hypothetical protein
MGTGLMIMVEAPLETSVGKEGEECGLVCGNRGIGPVNYHTVTVATKQSANR